MLLTKIVNPYLTIIARLCLINIVKLCLTIVVKLCLTKIVKLCLTNVVNLCLSKIVIQSNSSNIISPIGLLAYEFYSCEQCPFKTMYFLITIPYFKGRLFDSNYVVFVHKFIYFHALRGYVFFIYLWLHLMIFRLPTYPWRGSCKFVVFNLRFQI